MFSIAHLHLLVNHFPIIVPICALLLLIAGRMRRSEETTRIGLAFLVGGALMTIPTYFSGEGAEHAVRRAPGVTRDILEAHQDAAVWGAVLMALLGVFALWALWQHRRPNALPAWVSTAALLGTLLISVVMGRVGLLGGAVRHTEVRSDAPANFGMPAGVVMPVDSSRGGPARGEDREP